MPDVESIPEVSEEYLFNEAVSDEVPDSPVTAEQSEPEQTEQARDEAGRFAKAEAEAENPAVAEQGQKPVVDDDAPQVPSWRVRELREERDALKRQLEEARRQPAQPVERKEPAVTVPDPLLDPEGYAKHVREQIREDMLNERREDSLRAAHGKYGAEFDEAYRLAKERIDLDPALKAKMQASRDPGETLIQWHREQKVMREVGNDPNAWLEKKLEERLKDPAFLAKAIEASKGVAQTQTNVRPIISLPPSLNGASRSNAVLKSVNDDVTDEQLFHQLTG